MTPSPFSDEAGSIKCFCFQDPQSLTVCIRAAILRVSVHKHWMADLTSCAENHVCSSSICSKTQILHVRICVYSTYVVGCNRAKVKNA